MRRPAADIRQFDRESCEVCVITNLLYIFHVIDHTNAHWVDEQLNRKSDTILDDSYVLFLLRQGLSVLSISEFDLQATIDYGVEYLRHYHRKLWNDKWEQMYTPEFIIWIIERAIRVKDEVAASRLPYYKEPRPPTMEDISHFMKEGYVVDLAMPIGGGPQSHALMLYGIADNGEYEAFWPCKDQTSLVTLSAGNIRRIWDGMWLNVWWRE